MTSPGTTPAATGDDNHHDDPGTGDVRYHGHQPGCYCIEFACPVGISTHGCACPVSTDKEQDND